MNSEIDDAYEVLREYIREDRRRNPDSGMSPDDPVLLTPEDRCPPSLETVLGLRAVYRDGALTYVKSDD